jgi:hypothetical protein
MVSTACDDLSPIVCFIKIPKAPFIREKFTKVRTAARKLAAEYFERYPKDRLSLSETQSG